MSAMTQFTASRRRGATGVLILCSLAAVFVLGPVAYANNIPPGDGDEFPPLSLFFGDPDRPGQGPPDHVSPPGLEKLSETHFRFGGEWAPPHGRWLVSYEIDADPDPFLDAQFEIINNDPVARDFVLTLVLPIATPTQWGTLSGGSFSGVLRDRNGDGAVLESIPGEPMYMAKMDGADFQPLMEAPQSFTASGPYQTFVTATEHFGVPIPTDSRPTNVTSTIEIETMVRLSAYDRATLYATFVVEPRPEPEPATMGLLAIGACTLLFKRRRRRP